MFVFLSELIVVVLINLFCIITSLRIKNNLISKIIMVLLCMSCLKYVVQYIFYSASTPLGLFQIRGLYMISIPSVMAISYLSLRYLKNDRIRALDYINTILILVLIGMAIFRATPGIELRTYGYGICYDGLWETIIAIAVIVFGLAVILVSIKNFWKKNKPVLRLAYFIFSFGYAIIILESLLYLLKYTSALEYISGEGIVLLGVFIVLNSLNKEYESKAN